MTRHFNAVMLDAATAQESSRGPAVAAMHRAASYAVSPRGATDTS
jgi:hypothetical protein